MTELYLNPFSIETTQEKWNQISTSKFGKAKDVVNSLRYDLLVKNPYKLIVGNTNNIILNDCASDIEKIAASIILVLACVYTTAMYGFFIHSFGVSIHKIAIFSNSEKIAKVACVVKEVGDKMLMLASVAVKSSFYSIPKELIERVPVFLRVTTYKIFKIVTLTFDKILVPLYKLIKKVLVWNYLQVVLAARIVFDKTLEMYDWTFQNMAIPFWKKQIEPRIEQFRNTAKAYKIIFPF